MSGAPVGIWCVDLLLEAINVGRPRGAAWVTLARPALVDYRVAYWASRRGRRHDTASKGDDETHQADDPNSVSASREIVSYAEQQ